MSFKDCLSAAVMKGLLKDGKAKEAADMFDEVVEDLKAQGASEAQARTQAAKTVSEDVARKAQLAKRRAALSVMAADRIRTDITSHINPLTGNKSPGEAAIAIFENSAGTESIQSVKRQRQTLQGRYLSKMADIIDAYGSKGLNIVQNRAGIRNVIRELFGQNTGDESAKAMAKGFSEASEMARIDAVNAGADIPKREDWGLPQGHNQSAVAMAGFDEWRKAIEGDGRLWNKTVDVETRRPIPESMREKVLRDVFDTIKTAGMIKMEAGGVGKASLANSMKDHRFLVFDNADDWLAYYDKFGEGDLFATMTGHIEHMARTNALLQVLGPNPAHMKEYIKGLVRNEAAKVDVADAGPAKKLLTQQTALAANTVDELFGMAMGNSAAPARPRLARSMAGLRNVLTSAQLGGAALAAIPGDIMTSRMTAKLNGLNASRMIGEYARMLNPLDGSDRALAKRSGLVAENAISTALGQQRLVGEVIGPQFTRRLADTVMRATLMSPHTEAARWAFSMEFMATLADNAGKKLDELEGPFKKAMERYQITSAQWDVIRKTTPYDHEGAKFLRPDDVIARADLPPGVARGVADRFMNMINTELEFAVPTTSDRARAALTGSSKGGTLVGELSRSFSMYKNFPVTIMFTHLRRGANLAAQGDKGAYLAQFVLMSAVAGAFTTQLKQVADGKDPRNMADPKFWGAALLTGGGLGLFGDFMFSNVNRFDSGIMATLAGPVAQFANDTRNLVTGNAVQLIDGEKPNFGRELVKYMDRYTPGSSIWYMRLAVDRLLVDQAQQMVDPAAHKAFSQRVKRTAKDTGQAYWWAPGTVAPGRAPDVTKGIQ